MPDYFNGYPVAAGSRHFTITYAAENDSDAQARAQAIAATCEADLSNLQNWFNCNYDDSPYAIWCHVLPGTPDGGSDNYGYEDGDESSRIFISGTYQPSAPDPSTNAIRDELARMLFVAELAEILMDFTGRGWNRGDSSGEALSRVAAAQLHPLGYYGSGRGPAINPWLQSDRQDFVTKPDNSDANVKSYGCCILFLNYLAYQLDYSFPLIVQAGGSSLADTFSRLTSQPSSNAFNQFEALLQKHIKYPLDFYAPNDNIFPLADNPSVAFMVNPQSFPPVQEPVAHQIVLKPGLICPEAEYTYFIEDVSFQMSVKAMTRGFAHSDFDWTLGGIPLSVHGGCRKCDGTPQHHRHSCDGGEERFEYSR